MKKYFSAFLILTMFSILGVASAGAEEQATEENSGPQKMMPRVLPRPEQRQKFIDAKIMAERLEREKFEARFRLNQDKEGAGVNADAKLRTENGESQRPTEEERREKIAQARAMVIRGFMHRIENFMQIVNRVKSRIEKLKGAGVDVDVSLELVAKAEASIAAAKEALAKAKASFGAGGEISEIKTSLGTAKESMKKAHEYLAEAIRKLKSNIPRKGPETSNEAGE